MPTFPTYRGELPECLNPRRLRHYLLLAYWVYFRPTALKCYLYQADPELYRVGPGLSTFRTLRTPAYRNLYLMAPYVILMLSIMAGLPIALATSWVHGTPMDWGRWAGGVAFGVAFGVAGGVAFGVAGGVAGGVAFGVAGGVVVGVVVGVMVSVVIGVAVGVAFGVAVGVAVSVAVGVALGAAFGVAPGAAFSVAAGAAFGVAFSVTDGVAFGVAFGVALGVAFGVASIMSVLRSIFCPFQLFPALQNAFRGKRHPLEQDEWVVLPLPGTRRALSRRLQQDETDGLRFLADAARNPFQRWAAQNALHGHLHSESQPIRFVYRLLTCPDLDVFVFAPATKADWERLPAIRRVLFGELDGRWVDCSSDSANRMSEWLVWAITWLLRDRRKTPLTDFAGVLYELLDEKAIETEAFDLAAHAEVYASLSDYPGGKEIARTFGTMATLLAYGDLADLPVAAQLGQDGALSYDDPVRPTVLSALARLGQVGAEIATHRDASSRVNQLAALARATDALDALDASIAAQVMAPEQYLLRRIVRQWRRLVSEAGGKVGRAEVAGPVANPYVFGNPVSGELFVGREDVLRRLEELWSGPGQKPSVVLYGHRRMGKSSILHNLGARFGPGTAIVDFNMQRVGLVANIGELLYNLALALYDSLPPAARGGVEGGEPGEERFLAHNPYTALDRFLRRLDAAREGKRYIVTIDEFELIERMIDEGTLEARLLDYLRGLIHTYPWLVMAFAGLHTLQEMTHDYWHPLYGSVTGIPVSFLGEKAAERLISQPTPDFVLDYDRHAIGRIIALTHGQPYLVQLICHGLVTRFNRQTYEQGVERERRFSVADVEAVIGAPEFYRDGDAYFTGVWRQAETSEPAGQTKALRALVQVEEGMTLSGIANASGLEPGDVQAALATLARHDVVIEEDERWRFTVELMRRWVAGQGTGEL